MKTPVEKIPLATARNESIAQGVRIAFFVTAVAASSSLGATIMTDQENTQLASRVVLMEGNFQSLQQRVVVLENKPPPPGFGDMPKELSEMRDDIDRLKLQLDSVTTFAITLTNLQRRVENLEAQIKLHNQKTVPG